MEGRELQNDIVISSVCVYVHDCSRSSNLVKGKPQSIVTKS